MFRLGLACHVNLIIAIAFLTSLLAFEQQSPRSGSQNPRQKAQSDRQTL